MTSNFQCLVIPIRQITSYKTNEMGTENHNFVNSCTQPAVCAITVGCCIYSKATKWNYKLYWSPECHLNRWPSWKDIVETNNCNSNVNVPYQGNSIIKTWNHLTALHEMNHEQVCKRHVSVPHVLHLMRGFYSIRESRLQHFTNTTVTQLETIENDRIEAHARHPAYIPTDSKMTATVYPLHRRQLNGNLRNITQLKFISINWAFTVNMTE